MMNFNVLRGVKKRMKTKGNVIEYRKCILPIGTFFVLECPYYLQDALDMRYWEIYGVFKCDYNHIAMTREEGIVEIYNEIKKGIFLYNRFHRGQNVEIHYDEENKFNIVVVKVTRGYYTYDDFLIDHNECVVCGYKKYSCGRRYAKSMGYKYIKND